MCQLMSVSPVSSTFTIDPTPLPPASGAAISTEMASVAFNTIG